MKPWYRNSTLQMDDPEMEWLQSKDPASCAVWEWLKADCQKRETNHVRILSQQEIDVVSRKLGIDTKRFHTIIEHIRSIEWISPILPNSPQASQNLQTVSGGSISMVRGWSKWQERNRTNQEDSLRKQVEYWRGKVENQQLTKAKPVSPHFLPNSPKPPQSEERRGDQSKEVHGGLPPVPQDEFIQIAEVRGVTKDCSEWYWNDCQKAGWLDSKLRPITDPWPGLINCWKTWRENKHKRDLAGKSNGANGSVRKPFISELHTQRQAVIRQIDTHVANPQSVSYNRNCTDLEKSHLRSLRKKEVELNNQIANGGDHA